MSWYKNQPAVILVTAPELVQRLVELFPDFRESWDGPGNCFRNGDGTYTLHGVFAEFTHFFRERYNTLSPDRVAALGKFVSECLSTGGGELGNAASTCFLENIAGEECERPLARHLVGEARKYWLVWGGRDEPNGNDGNLLYGR